MFFPSTSYTGYGKGKYSHAMPAGVAFIGILFLVIGMIIALRFPGIINDWTREDICIISETHHRFKSWVSNSDRDVEISVSVLNLTRMGHEPEFNWTSIFKFIEQSEKRDLNFMPSHHVVFTKYSNYDTDYVDDSTMTVPNLWLIRQYSILGDASTWIHNTLPKLITQIDCDLNSTCTKLLDWVQPNSTVKFLKPFMDSIMNAIFDHGPEKSNHQSCIRDFMETKDSNCPRCFSKLPILNILLLNRHFLASHASGSTMPWSRLKLCYIDHGYLISTDLISDGDFYQIIFTVNDQVFNHLRRKLILELISKQGLFHTGTADRVIGQNSSWTLGILPALFGGHGDHVYDWDTCNIQYWNVDANINFQWKSLDSVPIEWNAKSEYFVSPPSRLDPCLNPNAPLRIPVMLDGLWKPAMFTFSGVQKLHGETVYIYQLTAKSLPYDNEMEQDDLKINITHILGFESYVEPQKSNGTNNADIIIAKMYIEPITGSVWKLEITLDMSILIPPEILARANLSNFNGLSIPLARVKRVVTVREEAAKFLKDKLKPMLAVICGGVIIATLLAIGFVALALALVVKLHWTPFRERTQVKPEPQDLQMLNTIKLRKMMGH